tara:strand:+ start:4866 stop:5852 length:987 start_codon:yes stop_codon:yes gene_type:complete
MASSYTSNTGIEKPATGEQAGTWGTTTNTNFDIIDRALNGVGAVTLSGTTHTLTTSDGSLSDGMFKVLVLGGSPSGTNTITISPNTADKLYFVYNNSGQTATFSQGSGANVSITTGSAKIIYADGAGTGAAVSDFTNLLSIGLGGTAITSTAAELNLLDGVTATTSELNYVDTTAGTVAASKAVVVDSNKDTSGIRNLTITGTLNSGTPALLATAQEFTATQNFNETTLTDASTIAWDASANQVTKVTLTANRTLGAATNQVQGGVYVLTIIQDGTGSRTVTFNSTYKFASRVPTLTTTASARDILVFLSDGTNMYEIGRSLNPSKTS